MQSLRVTIAYDGTDFSGWQIQTSQRTVQGVLEKALQQVTGQPTRVTASGRTDAGVHAWEQIVSLRSDTLLEPAVLCRALNATTPDDLEVREVCHAADDFHAIRDAVAKRYRYTIQDGPRYDLFARRYAWQIPQRLDVNAMQTASDQLTGRHDFRSFEAAGSPRKTSVRTVTDVLVHRQASPAGDPIHIEIEADGFLYNMVRNIVGTLVLVGRGDRQPEWVTRVLAAKDRKKAGPTAPARGLALLRVKYGKDKGNQ